MYVYTIYFIIYILYIILYDSLKVFYHALKIVNKNKKQNRIEKTIYNYNLIICLKAASVNSSKGPPGINPNHYCTLKLQIYFSEKANNEVLLIQKPL